MGGSKRPRMEDDEINSSCENDPISGTDSVSKEKINLEPLHLPPYDEEATRRYYQQSRESEGLDVDYYPTIKLVGGIAPITEMNDKIKNEVERCSRAAIQNYNEEKVPNLMASSSNPKKQKGRVVEEVVLHDWRRTEGALNPVRNQELTESCWAFAITAGMESSYYIINNFQCQIILSPQDLLDNYEREDDVKENGAQPFRVFNWIFYNGCVSDEVCPFRNNVDKISIPNRKPQYRIDTFKMVPYKDLEKEVAERPIVAQLNYTDEFWELKKDEIYCGPKGSYCPSKLTGYSVLIVGFGKIKEKGREKKYCIVRNSWGKEWCDNGYGKVSLELVFDSERKEHVPLLDSMLSPVSVIKM